MESVSFQNSHSETRLFIFTSKITPHISVILPCGIPLDLRDTVWVRNLNEPLTHSFTQCLWNFLWSSVFLVITFIGGLSWLWREKLCYNKPRKPEVSCSIPLKPHAHCWAEETISGLPSAWRGWNRASVGLEGLRGIRIIGGANFLCWRLPAVWRYCKLLLSAEKDAL